MESKSALIFDIYRGTSHDGPGQRDTVFFKGCPLSCKWCHNPEGISPRPLVWWQGRQCIGCGICHDTCMNGANLLDEKGVHIDRSKCAVCGACVQACPAQALSMCGETVTLEGLLREVLKYKVYFDKTGGGVTASGGEAMLQYPFVAEFFKALHENGVSTALDTSGFAPREHFEAVLEHTDYILYDLKLWDSRMHEKYTGVDNRIILDNARWIAGLIKSGQLRSELWIRTPLIPGATANEENLRAIGAFIHNELGDEAVSRWELCAFNNSCLSKYERLEKNWEYAGNHALKKDEAERLRKSAALGGYASDKLFVTGILTE